MATFLLVHGAWLGGWFWGRVRNELHDAKQNVLAPTLTGLGERAHLATPEVGLETHIRDISAVIEYEAIHKIVLVGHGYGGMIISALAARHPGKFTHAVFVDAVVPEEGESFFDVIGADAAEKLRQAAKQRGEGWRVPFDTPFPDWGITSEVDLRYTNYRMTPHPLKTFSDKLEPGQEAAPTAPRVPHIFIRCTKPALSRIETSAQRARAAGWRYHEIQAGHAAPVTAPRDLARLLLALHEA